MFQIVPCVIANISWKFNENPLIDFTVVLLTNMPGAPRWETVIQSWHIWNSLANYFFVSCLTFHKKFIKIRLPVFPQYCKQTRIQKIDESTQDSKGLPQHLENVSDRSLCQVRPFLKISCKSVETFFFCNAANGVDSSEKVEQKFLCLRG